MQQINHQNYDLVFKEAFSLFENRSLDFLGLDLPRITGFMETEFPEVETQDDRLDLTFWLEDNTILHLEEETHLSREDLIRFAHYDLRLYSRYKTTIHTIVLTPFTGSEGIQNINTGSLQYTVTQLILGMRDGDALIEKIQSALKRGEDINELELIFLPLMKSSLPVDALLRKTIELAKEIPRTTVGQKICELSLVVSNRIVDEETLGELWEELRMLKVIKFAEKKGMEKGLEKGREDGQRKTIKQILIKKFGPLPHTLSQAIDTLDPATLDFIIYDILDMKTIEELRRYIPEW
jgi:hypothetical protein